MLRDTVMMLRLRLRHVSIRSDEVLRDKVGTFGYGRYRAVDGLMRC